MADFVIDRPQYIRELMSFKDTDLIKIVTGVRRSGKSTVFDLYVAELLKQGVSKEQIQIIKLEEVENEHLLDYHKVECILFLAKHYTFLTFQDLFFHIFQQGEISHLNFSSS